MVLTAENLVKNYGLKPLLADVSLYVDKGDKIGIIGLNGTGKSTFLRVLAMEEEADAGDVTTDPGVRISYLPQIPDLHAGLTVLQEAMHGFSPAFCEENEYMARALLSKVGITDLDAKIETLSGGQRKRVALARAFLKPADVLVLDEPTNHLDSDMVLWLEQRLITFTGCIIMVTHDRYFLERIVNRIVELNHGKTYEYEANYSKYLELRQQRADMAAASERKRQALLRRETEWIQRGARARSTKSVERIARYEALKEQSGPETDPSGIQISAIQSRLGKKTIELTDISKTFDGRTVLSGFSYTVLRDDRIGIVGRNGAGKSTLLKLISRITAPTEGSISINGRVASLLEIGTGFHPELTGRENIFLNGAIMGMTRSETKMRMADILEFSEIEKFIDTPVKRYSSGMTVKLGFAVAANLDPDILICDEVLAVGDAAFQQKCLAKMSDVAKEGSAVLYVSHNMRTVSQLCNRVICLDHGMLTYDGAPQAGIEKYVGSGAGSAGRCDFTMLERPSGLGESARVEWAENTEAPEMELDPDGETLIRVGLWSDGSCSDIRVRVTWSAGDYAIGTSETGAMDLPMGRHAALLKLPLEMLSGGEYALKLEISGKKRGCTQVLDSVSHALHLKLKDDRSLNLGVVWDASYWGNVRVKGTRVDRVE